MMITRDVINPDINYHGYTKQDLCQLIDKWKRLLVEKHGAQKGQTLAIGIMTVNHNHVAALFAGAELGMKIFLITKPIAVETLHATKMGQFGPVDITVTQRFPDGDIHYEMFSRYSKRICYEDEAQFYATVPFQPWEVYPEDDLIFASTSGTTSDSRPVMFSHRDAYELSKRNISVFKLGKENVIQHTANMHHASSMLTSLIPSLMVCDQHYFGSVSLGMHFISSERPHINLENMCRRGVDRFIVGNIGLLYLIVSGFKDTAVRPAKRFLVNVSGFTVPENLYQMCHDYPIDLISHYGSIDTGIPILVNYVDRNSVYRENYLGKTVDVFYRVSDNTVSCDLWDADRSMPDDLLNIDGEYFYQGRRNTEVNDDETLSLLKEQLVDYSVVKTDKAKYLVVWDKPDLDYVTARSGIQLLFEGPIHLNKEDFFIDTKISMEQLRAYLDHNYLPKEDYGGLKQVWNDNEKSN
jgi:acyl-coenzyme A synthetase/AMP-(fatty) acid ligase